MSKTTYKYIIQQREKSENIFQHKSSLSIYEEIMNSSVDNFISDLNITIKSVNPLLEDEPILIQFLKLFTYYLDTVTYLNLTGIFALINKDDCEGHYSVGNSYDILQTIQLLIPFVERTDLEEQYFFPFLSSIVCLFQESINTKQNVVFNLIDNTPSNQRVPPRLIRWHQPGSRSWLLSNKK
ncbi:MAG: hypothetical protein EBS86_05415 [Crocinitomicaceae bacterium]|nr:hypothetical protein [Crocinitomicaceae bacterium]